MEGLSSEMQYLDFGDLLAVGAIQEGYGLVQKDPKTSKKRKAKGEDIPPPTSAQPTSPAPPKPPRAFMSNSTSILKFELIGNNFSKDSYVLVNRIDQDGKPVKETFNANKFPVFLGSLLKTDPDAYGKFLKKAINVLNSEQ